MADITAKVVNEFRQITGLGLMECKKLLQEAEGDLKKATQLAKERGLKNAEKRSGRSAKAGRIEVGFNENNTAGAIVELNCETDFVARNDAFRAMTGDLLKHVIATASAGVELLAQQFVINPAVTIKEALVDLNARTGENIGIASQGPINSNLLDPVGSRVMFTTTPRVGRWWKFLVDQPNRRVAMKSSSL